MASALEVIKKFMYSLDNTNESGVSALDDAVNYASNGKFTSMGDLVNSYINDLSAYGSDSYWEADSSTFLREKCGILLDNSDTGAITGSDAGGTTEKTAESVVPESGSTSYLSYPTSASSTFNGLTIYWPDAWSLTDSQQAVVSRLNQWWMSGALGLVQESFDMNFREYGTTVNTIGLNFYNSYDNVLASVGYSYNPYNGEASELTLNINMYYYDSLDYNDVNGKAADTSAYLDRTLAHELTHAVMAANIDYFVSLPTFVKEGLAELVHGIDDEREYTIRSLAQADKVSRMRDYVFNLTQYYNCGEDSYAGGYMLFRYFAKQASTSYDEEESDLPLNADYEDAEKAIVRLFEEFTGTFDSSWYESTIRTVDATGNWNDLTIVGNANDNLLKAGSGSTELYGQTGNDTLVGGTGEDYLEGGSGNDSLLGNAGNDSLRGGAGNDILTGGAGNDTFFYADGDGKDTIRDYAVGDVIRITKGSLKSGKVSGKDVILTVGSGSMTLKNAVGKKITLVDAMGNTTDKTYTDATLLPKNASYGDKGKTLVNLSAGFTGTFDAGKYASGIKTVDATKNAKALTIKGNADANLLKAGSGNTKLYGQTGNDTLVGGKGKDYLEGGSGSDSLLGNAGNDSLRGGAGNDILTGGAGNDTFFYAEGDGKDTIRDYAAGDVIRITKGSLKSGKASGKDVILTVGSGSMTLKNAVGKKITMVDAKGKKIVKTYADPTKLPKNAVYGDKKKTVVNLAAGFAGTFDGSKYGTTIKTVDATKNKKALTIKGNANANLLKAGSGNTKLYGQTGNDTLVGGKGKDYLEGGSGNDSLLGNAGNDSLRGGAGNDILTGGAGNDTFFYADGDGKDTIRDYAVGDVIRITKGSLKSGKVSGKDVILTVGSGSMTLKNAVGKKITMVDAKGKKIVKTYADPTKLPKNAVYGDKKKTVVNLAAGFAGTFDGSKYGTTIKTVDATKNKKALTIKGNVSANLLKAGSGNTKLYGQTGNDTLVGGKGKDYLEGGSGNDSLLGNAGNDTLYGGAGNDILTGGAGADVFRYRNGDGNDTIRSFESNKDIIDLYDADYTWSRVGSTSDVKLTIGRGSILLKGAWQKTAKIKDRYEKTASVKFTESTPVMPAFDNTIKGTELSDDLRDAWDDVDDLFYGYGGNDTLWSHGGNDYMDGGAGNDYIGGFLISEGSCTLFGGTGNDTLSDGGGDDSLNGGDGDDLLRAYDGGNDTVYGGAGNDSMHGHSGNNYLDAGSGDDYVNYISSYGNNTVLGGTGNDDIVCGYGDDSVDGGAGNDTISVCSGGNNTLRGGTGDDDLSGGDGIDRFVYAAGDGNDTIGYHGYESNKDIIDLSGVDYTVSRTGYSDVLITAGTGSILLQYAAGVTLKINDRYGNFQYIDTNNLPHSYSSFMLASSSAALAEDTGASYVAPETWSLDSSVDSIRAEREAAFAAKSVVMAPDASLGGSMALAYGNGGSQREGNEQNRFA